MATYLRFSLIKIFFVFVICFFLLNGAAVEEEGKKKVKKRKVRKKSPKGPGGATIEEAMANAEKEREEMEKDRKPPHEKKKTQFSKFDDLDIRKLEEAWQEGDDEELLRTDFDLIQDEIERRKRSGPNIGDFISGDGSINDRDMQQILQQQKMGPTMMFVNLGEVNPHTGKPWEPRTFEELTRKWKGLLLSGGHDDVSVFNMGEGYSKILIQIQKGWRSFEIKDFLLSQPECHSITWDNQEYFPKKIRHRDEL